MAYGVDPPRRRGRPERVSRCRHLFDAIYGCLMGREVACGDLHAATPRWLMDTCKAWRWGQTNNDIPKGMEKMHQLPHPRQLLSPGVFPP